MSVKLLKALADVAVTAIALSSLIFMGFVFFIEVQGGRVTYYEPNRNIAFTELLLTAFSFGGIFGMWIRRFSK